jgi:hypothetical protein
MLNQWFGALMQSFNLLPFLAKVITTQILPSRIQPADLLTLSHFAGASDKVSDRQRHHYRRGGRGLQSR